MSASSAPLEYREGEPFPGAVGTTLAESVPAFLSRPTAPAGSPNVLMVVLDDVGYAQLGCYGSDIETPNIDALADGGLRYRNFHTTAMCSPTRACLLTGRNSHSNGLGAITELANGFPGYHGRVPLAHGFLSEMLLDAGYATMAVGKWHLAPQDELHAAAPRNRWPLGRGFERYYGFLGAETSQWEPDLVADNHVVPTPRRPGYHLTEDLVDRAVGMIHDLRSADPGKPFFMYFCPGACHAPHQVPEPWIERYRGRFDRGWDVWREQTHARQLALGVIPPGTALTPRPPWIPAWDDLTDDERRLYARMMEVFAGFLSHTDHHLGRLLDAMRTTGDLDDTIVVLVSDNGASAEGGPHGSVNENLFFNGMPDTVEVNLAHIDELGGTRTYGHYPFGWALAGNTPFQRWKRETHEGGTADPLIVHWPAGIAARGEVRGQYAHAVDVLPTLLDMIGIELPSVVRGADQTPIAGRSLVSTLSDADAPEVRRTQYYEQMGCRAIYHDGWKAVAYHALASVRYDGVSDPAAPYDQDRWELYNVAEDFSESIDLAEARPDLLRRMVDLWWAEAGRFDVLPLNSQPIPLSIRLSLSGRTALSGAERRADQRPGSTYWPGAAPVPAELAVNLKRRPHDIVAAVEVPADGCEGVLLAHGGRFGGYALYVSDGRLAYASRHTDLVLTTVTADRPLTSGAHHVGMSFETRGEGGVVRLFVDGEQVGEGTVPATVPFQYALVGEGLCCGYDDGSAVGDYTAPFPFTGTIHRVVVGVDGEPVEDLRAELERALRTQ